MSSIERKWWFVMPVAGLSGMFMMLLAHHAGITPVEGASRYLLLMLCYAALYRGLSFIGWLGLLLVAPGLADKRLHKKLS
ncbi:hypothetical protein [Janthinobacterium sp.]|uniref:hypothetical protein n=1 Tax=Janthinobacterium sp. TaxID=1871054 RepID=UPI00262F026F|nr:hypothetical protein [Janthinobacterium sp.]